MALANRSRQRVRPLLSGESTFQQENPQPAEHTDQVDERVGSDKVRRCRKQQEHQIRAIQQHTLLIASNLPRPGTGRRACRRPAQTEILQAPTEECARLTLRSQARYRVAWRHTRWSVWEHTSLSQPCPRIVRRKSRRRSSSIRSRGCAPRGPQALHKTLLPASVGRRPNAEIVDGESRT